MEWPLVLPVIPYPETPFSCRSNIVRKVERLCGIVLFAPVVHEFFWKLRGRGGDPAFPPRPRKPFFDRLSDDRNSYGEMTIVAK